MIKIFLYSAYCCVFFFVFLSLLNYILFPEKRLSLSEWLNAVAVAIKRSLYTQNLLKYTTYMYHELLFMKNFLENNESLIQSILNKDPDLVAPKQLKMARNFRDVLAWIRKNNIEDFKNDIICSNELKENFFTNQAKFSRAMRIFLS